MEGVVGEATKGSYVLMSGRGPSGLERRDGRDGQTTFPSSRPSSVSIVAPASRAADAYPYREVRVRDPVIGVARRGDERPETQSRTALARLGGREQFRLGGQTALHRRVRPERPPPAVATSEQQVAGRSVTDVDPEPLGKRVPDLLARTRELDVDLRLELRADAGGGSGRAAGAQPVALEQGYVLLGVGRGVNGGQPDDPAADDSHTRRETR